MKITNLSSLRDPLTTFQLNPILDELRRLLSSLPIYQGRGSPEGVVQAKTGSVYLNLDGGAGTTLYVKESEDGRSTGWAAK